MPGRVKFQARMLERNSAPTTTNFWPVIKPAKLNKKIAAWWMKHVMTSSAY
jgi:hypothetical protein